MRGCTREVASRQRGLCSTGAGSWRWGGSTFDVLERTDGVKVNVDLFRTHDILDELALVLRQRQLLRFPSSLPLFFPISFHSIKNDEQIEINHFGAFYLFYFIYYLNG